MLVNSTQRLEADIGPDSDLEGEFLQKRIDYHKSVRQAKPRRSDWTNMLVKREVEHWQKLVPTLYILDSFLLLTVTLWVLSEDQS